MKLNIIFFLGIVVLGGLSCTDSGKNQLKVEDDYFINPIFSSGSNPNALFYGGKYYYTHETKLLQKSEMRKNMVMDLIYRGFIYAANYSESHYNPRRSQIKTELRYLFVTTPNR